ncbi:unnamed protein product [Owenia fusiformis]|uniref:Uncharacterized protein n=1 Tax=Owenia fusiformis TaxID=6347 RepID=A0A8J1T5M9_OWEFU|nr:unnamed protein product [Owenia fusiformis]
MITKYAILCAYGLSIIIQFAACGYVSGYHDGYRGFSRRRNNGLPVCGLSDCKYGTWGAWTPCRNGNEYRFRESILRRNCIGKCLGATIASRSCNGAQQIQVPRVSKYSVTDFCKGKNSGHYADPLDCAYFITCIFKKSVRRKCATGTVWNQKIQGCDYKSQVQCNLKQPSNVKPVGVHLVRTVQTTFRDRQHKTTLPVTYKPHVPKESSKTCFTKFQQIPQNATVREGETVMLGCSSKGSTISWTKNGGTIPKSITMTPEGHLKLSQVELSDAGSYTCIAKYDGCRAERRVWLRVRKRFNNDPPRKVYHGSLKEVCGRPVVNTPSMGKPEVRRGLIVGGNDAEKGSSPWQVMLWEATAGPFCGGALVSKQWLVTAAHCFREFPEQYKKELTKDNLVIKLGKWDREDDEAYEVTLTAEEFVIHPDFDHDLYDNDIALIKLSQPIEYSNYILPICISDTEFASDNLFKAQTFGTVTGWGALAGYNAPRPRFLNEIRLPIVNQKTCKSSTGFKVTENMFCAGYKREIVGDACEGDSGGPFIMKHEDRWYLAGLVSWGEGCALEGKYGFYTRVSQYYNWITSTLQS